MFLHSLPLLLPLPHHKISRAMTGEEQVLGSGIFFVSSLIISRIFLSKILLHYGSTLDGMIVPESDSKRHTNDF